MMIGTDLIDFNGSNVRRIAADPAQDQALRDSIEALGVLQPLLVRQAGARYTLIAGHRRLTAARELALAEVQVELSAHAKSDAVAAAAAENMVRAVMHPVDQWRAIEQLRRGGYSIATASRALGLDERLTRRFELLGRMAPALIDALIADWDRVAADRMIRTIASAPVEVQERAVRKFARPGKVVAWHDIVAACSTQRIPRGRALFDVETAGVAFDEDLFAEPGSADQFTTADVEGFLRAQRAALEARVAASKGTEEIALERHGQHVVPRGFAFVSSLYGVAPDTTKLKRGQRRLLSVGAVVGRHDLGQVTSTIVAPIPKPKAAARADASPGAQVAEDDVVGGSTGGVTSPAGEPDADEARDAVTRLGRQAIAAAKTDAIGAALRAHAESSVLLDAHNVLALLILAVTGDNVTVEQPHGAGARPRDLRGRVVDASGMIACPPEEAIRLGLELLAMMVQVKADAVGPYGRGSGVVAEWIGFAIGADDHLPRMDTEAMLAAIKGRGLEAMATSAGILAPKKATELRKALLGKAPKAKPPGAEFGAPGPVPTRQAAGGIAREATDDAA